MQDSQSPNPVKRYATAAIILGGGAVLGSSALVAHLNNRNYGVPISHNGQKYYIRDDSKRTVYPTREACLADVPVSMQKECEPVANYRSGGGGWYGPVWSQRDSGGYTPSSRYPSEKADSSNVGKQLPGGANSHGFGSNGKAFTGSTGG
jgi:hypothetical protein